MTAHERAETTPDSLPCLRLNSPISICELLARAVNGAQMCRDHTCEPQSGATYQQFFHRYCEELSASAFKRHHHWPKPVSSIRFCARSPPIRARKAQFRIHIPDSHRPSWISPAVQPLRLPAPPITQQLFARAVPPVHPDPYPRRRAAHALNHLV